jgi:hypothetical protein
MAEKDARAIRFAAILAIGALTIATSPSGASRPGQPLAALSPLQPGLWQIRELGNDRAAPQSICIADPAMLLQVKHYKEPCSRLVIADEANQATVHYTCPANGFGRTWLRVETPRLAKIDTQGIVDNTPFAFRAEARFVGPCGPKRSARR